MGQQQKAARRHEPVAYAQRVARWKHEQPPISLGPTNRRNEAVVEAEAVELESVGSKTTTHDHSHRDARAFSAEVEAKWKHEGRDGSTLAFNRCCTSAEHLPASTKKKTRPTEPSQPHRHIGTGL